LQPRPPVCELSRWHLALALAAGAISGVVRSKSGRILVVKGDTYKDKVRKTEFTEDDDGNITEVRILTDRFIPIIWAWEMTPS
ncbi:class I SAM-dependent methyltransferase, partial [Pseudomonas aeruginosa]